MNVKETVEKFLNYEREQSVAHTVANYKSILFPFLNFFEEKDVENLTPEDVFSFLSQRTDKCNKTTKHVRFTQLKAFFNFCKGGLGLSIVNPCSSSLFAMAYRSPKLTLCETIAKEVIDELIFRTVKLRNRLLLEIQARSGLRVGEVLKLRPRDIEGRKITLISPKSGREFETAFLPKGVSERLNTYVEEEKIQPDVRIFPFTYSCARSIVRKAGELVGIHLRPHDLRRHSATYASRNGVPLEVVSKVILRHQDLRTSQLYLGKVSDDEALHWIDTLHSV
ncbi:MAG: site-specific integrase [bacterium]